MTTSTIKKIRINSIVQVKGYGKNLYRVYTRNEGGLSETSYDVAPQREFKRYENTMNIRQSDIIMKSDGCWMK